MATEFVDPNQINEPPPQSVDILDVIEDPAIADREAFEEFKQELRLGHWLGLSEEYLSRGKWTAERIARDAWQNFFDANGGTLDGIDIEITQDEDGETIVIKGVGNYDFRYLLGMGETHKDNVDEAAGGEGEGAKLVALQLIRDWQCEEVLYEGEDWQLDFYFDKPPAGKVPDKNKDKNYLYSRLKDRDPQEENTLKIKTKRKGLAEEFIKAKELFRHSGNEDFKNPDIETKAGSLSVLEKKESGNLYINGQRIAYSEKGKWNTLSGFTFISNTIPTSDGWKLDIGRDRQSVDQSSFFSIVVPFFVESLSGPELLNLLKMLEPYYDDNHSYTPGPNFLEETITEMEKSQLTYDFPTTYVADDLSSLIEGHQEKDPRLEMLKSLGYTVCNENLGRIGMQKASDLASEITSLYEITPIESEQKRLDLLFDFFEDFVKQNRFELATKNKSDFEVKPIRIFGAKHPFLNGKYDEPVIWLEKQNLYHEEIDDLLSTCLHEYCHKFGTDNSAAFSYALTDILKVWTKYIRKNPEALNNLQKQWESIELEKERYAWTTEQEFLENYKRIFAITGIYDSSMGKRYESRLSETGTVDEVEYILMEHYDDKFSSRAIIEICGKANDHESFQDLSSTSKRVNKLMTTRKEKQQHLADTNLGKDIDDYNKSIQSLEDLRASRKRHKGELKKEIIKLKRERAQKESQYQILSDELAQIGDELRDLSRLLQQKLKVPRKAELYDDIFVNLNNFKFIDEIFFASLESAYRKIQDGVPFDAQSFESELKNIYIYLSTDKKHKTILQDSYFHIMQYQLEKVGEDIKKKISPDKLAYAQALFESIKFCKKMQSDKRGEKSI
jgi:hypothetical protein